MAEQKFSHIRDRDLIEKLIENDLVQESALHELLSKQTQAYQQSQEKLRGQLYQVNLDSQELEVKQSIELSTLYSVELAPNHPEGLEWHRWAEQIIVLDPEKPQILESLLWKPEHAIGLTLSEQGPYVYMPNLATQKYLFSTRHLLDPREGESSGKVGPYDFYLSHDSQLLCLADRAAGDIYLIDPDEYAVTEIYTLRDTQSQRSIMVEGDPARQQLFYVDPDQRLLGILNYSEGLLETVDLKGQRAVNLEFDGTFLYVLIQHPKPALLKLETEYFEVLARLELPEKLFSDYQSCPANPMVLNPDASLLALLLGQNPKAEIMWVETETLKEVERKVLTGQPYPGLLCFGLENPLQTYRKRLAELLVEAELVSEKTLYRLFPPPAPEHDEGGTVLEIIRPEPKEETPSRAVAPEAEEDFEPLEFNTNLALISLAPIEKLVSLPSARPAENMPLPPEIEQEIVQLLSANFYQQTGIDLLEHGDSLERLEELAGELRIQLQDYSVVPVEIPNLIPGYPLRSFLLRESVVTLFALRKSVDRLPYDTPPTHCPACKVPLLGRWDCDSCGLELWSPERLSARRQGSVLPGSWMPPGYFSIPDVQGGRLLLVNTRKHNYVTWQIDFRSLPQVRQPWDMTWLEDMGMLVCDRKGNQVLHLSFTGRTLWAYSAQDHPELKLLEPTRATVRQEMGETRYLIVDQGHHRVLEVDEEMKLHWSFGQQGHPHGDDSGLYSPMDLQYTHEGTYLITDTGNDRVLEVRGHRIQRSFGRALNLNRPVFAQRLFSGHTLIVDAGNFRILELDEDGEILKDVHYFREGMDERFDMTHPQKVVRRDNQNIVLIDTNRVMEIDLLSKKIVWFSFLHDLKMDLDLPQTLNQPTIKVTQAPPFESYEASEAPEEMPTLRRSLQKVSLFQDASAHFYDEIEKHMHYRSYKAGEIILKAGQMNQRLFVVQSGQIKVDTGGQEGLVLKAGDSFGFMGIIYKESRKSDVCALSDCGVYYLDKRDFDVMLPEFPEIEAAAKKLAQERLVVSRLKQTPKTQQATERLKSLIESHKKRSRERLEQYEHKAVPRLLDHDRHRLSYNEIEKHVIAQAIQSGLSCYELHINLRPAARMKAARVALIAAVLDKAGTMIRTDPSPEDILDEKFGSEVIMTLISELSAEQLSEDVQALVDIQAVTVFPVEAEQAHV